MIFKKKNTPTKYDIPIVNMKIKELFSNDVIQLVDYSNKISGNNISRLVLSFYADDTFKLNSYVRYSDILLTDEMYYNTDNGKNEPLFYVGYTEFMYYNNNKYKQEITVECSGSEYDENERIINGLIPINSNNVIVYNSVKVTKTVDGSSVEIDNYDINYGNGSLYIHTDELVQVNLDNPVFKIEYYLITPDVSLDISCNYRIELEETEKSGFYFLRILTETNQIFSIEYKATKYGSIELKKEDINPISLYQEVDMFTYNLITSTYRIFTIEESLNGYYVYIINNFPDRQYYIKPAYDRDSMIYIDKPDYKNFNEKWYCTCMQGKVFSNLKTYTINSSLNNIKKFNELANFIDNNRISVRNKNLIASKDSNGEWKNIKVYRIKGQEITIKSVNLKDGIIELSENISPLETIRVEYILKDTRYELENMCFNPLIDSDKHGINISNFYFYHILIDDETVNTYSLPTNIFVGYIERYEEGESLVYNYDDLYNFINYKTEADVTEWGPLRQANRANIIDFDPYVVDTNEIDFEILSFIYLSNPIDKDGFYLEDVRINGGGEKAPNYSNYDYSLYDGEMTDLSTYLDIVFDQNIYDILIERYKTWDELVINSDDPDSEAKRVVNEKLENVVNRYLLLGSEGNIKVE